MVFCSWEYKAAGTPVPAAHLRIRRGLSRVPAASCEIATAPAEPRNDKLGSAFFPCHCEEGASPTWQSHAGTLDFAEGFPMFRPVAARLPRLLRSLAMTNLRVLPSCVIPRSEAPLALPLGELSPKVTERALQCFPLRRLRLYRGMAGTASISCRRFESEMSFRGHTAAQRPQETHLE